MPQAVAALSNSGFGLTRRSPCTSRNGVLPLSAYANCCRVNVMVFRNCWRSVNTRPGRRLPQILVTGRRVHVHSPGSLSAKPKLPPIAGEQFQVSLLHIMSPITPPGTVYFVRTASRCRRLRHMRLEHLRRVGSETRKLQHVQVAGVCPNWTRWQSIDVS